MKRAYLFILILSFLFVFSFGNTTQNIDKDNIIKKLNIASTEHDIIQLMIKNEEYEKVPAEIKNILDLELPSEYESAVLKEILIVSNDLHKRGKNKIALQILDMGYKYCEKRENKIIILKVKAAFLKSMGRIKEAISVFKDAIKLEKEDMGKR